ncbi:hypothetical protein GJAV_G00035890 [Gymnothorax javanicus]|nr:hypothetical protein GJAV_G00035890 [Gymnothorax javanicus]
METPSIAVRNAGDPSLPVSILQLLVPPLKLLSAAMWQILEQRAVVHYGKLEEFVSVVMEVFPELLNESQRTELTQGLQFHRKTDPPQEVMWWQFLSRLDELLPAPDLRQTVFWLAAAPSVLEVCLQSVPYTDDLRTILKHHKSLGQFNRNATLASKEGCQMPYTPWPPQRALDSIKLKNTDRQSDYTSLSASSSGEDVMGESVIDGSDYKAFKPKPSVKASEDKAERAGRKYGYSTSRKQEDLLINVKEEIDWERQSVEMEGEFVWDGRSNGKEKEWSKLGEQDSTKQASQADQVVMNTVKSEHGQRGLDPSKVVTSCLVKQPRVLIYRLKTANHSLPLSSSPHPVVTPLWANQSQRQIDQAMTQKRIFNGPSSQDKGNSAESSLMSAVVSIRNLKSSSDLTAPAVEASSQVFSCSQSILAHTEEENLQQLVEKVQPDELSRAPESQQRPGSSNPLPTPPNTLSTPTQSHTGSPVSAPAASFLPQLLETRLCCHWAILPEQFSPARALSVPESFRKGWGGWCVAVVPPH